MGHTGKHGVVRRQGEGKALAGAFTEVSTGTGGEAGSEAEDGLLDSEAGAGPGAVPR